MDNDEEYFIKHFEPDNAFGIYGLPNITLETYARLWQLETWLRRLVYLEIHTAYAEIEGIVEKSVPGDKCKSMNNDKRMIHMSTPEEDRLSFIQMSQLNKIIGDNWGLFSYCLPPKEIWDAKIKEVLQVRHRVAHFRQLHVDDLARVVQLIRDVDRGFWIFCTSFNDLNSILPQSKNQIISEYLHLNPFSYKEAGDGTWAQFGSAGPEVEMIVDISIVKRPWVEWSDDVDTERGFLYNVYLHARGISGFDYQKIINRSKRYFRNITAIVLDDFSKSLRVVFPSILEYGDKREIIDHFINECKNNMRHQFQALSKEKSDEIVAICNEKIISPFDPRSFLDPEMPCSFFSAGR